MDVDSLAVRRMWKGSTLMGEVPGEDPINHHFPPPLHPIPTSMYMSHEWLSTFMKDTTSL